MVEEVTQVVSGVRHETTPGGAKFDILRHAPADAAKIRGSALDKVKEMTQEREPGLTPLLEAEASAEYMISRVIAKAEDLSLKADLTRVWVRAGIDEGRYASALGTLAYADVHEADIPEMQNVDFVGDLYEKAKKEGSLIDAWMIAEDMIDPDFREKVIKSDKSDSPYNEGWKTREQNSFEEYARKELEKEKSGRTDQSDWRLQMLYDTFRFREEGYGAEQPSRLALDVAEAYAAKLADQPNRRWIAFVVASEAKLPAPFVEKLEEKLPKGERFKRKATRVAKTLASNLLGR